MILLKNKFILTITCDKNDADYLTKTTVLDAVPSEWFHPDLFIKTVKVLQKLVDPEPYKQSRIEKMYHNLTPEDIKILYDFDTYGEDEDWIKRLVLPPDKFAILDDIRTWDSKIRDLFPIDSEHLTWESEAWKINECHTIEKVDLIHIDENGLAYQI